LTWSPTLQGAYLGSAAMGFRAQTGPLHLAQLLTDLMVLQQRRGQQLWLASFDVEKCFPSLPWWAVFGVLARVGVDSATVACFRSFYSQLRQRFRYGQVDGSEWSMANGLAQGCPASPDLLNILYEAFHRWASAQRKGVPIDDVFVASASFADDLVLVATSWEDMEFLIYSYLEWCRLLGLTVNLPKTQLWRSAGKGWPVVLAIGDAPVTLFTRDTFRIVGIELGLAERPTTVKHLSPRLAKAQLTVKRLAALPIAATVAARMWRSAVLPQALYGCELRQIPTLLKPLCGQVRTVANKAPLGLSNYGAIEVISGLPLGACAVRDPRLEVLSRQLRWVVTLANSPGLVGSLHRQLAVVGDAPWKDPTPALSVALETVGWTLVRNTACLRASRWPALDPEPSFSGLVVLQAFPGLPVPAGTVWTDGSLGPDGGGAAAVQPSSGSFASCRLPRASSSTQCELVALSLVAQLEVSPPLVLTDSLVALQLIQSWGHRPISEVLACPERQEVRCFLDHWAAVSNPPCLMKVKAHDLVAIHCGDIRARGNAQADSAAKDAVRTSSHIHVTDERFGDAVRVRRGDGQWVVDLDSAIGSYWWDARRVEAGQRRTWIAALYPTGMEFDWKASTAIFLLPVVVDGAFVHVVPPPVLKWVARARAGALATSLRKATTGLGISPSPACPCCGAASEDDAHVVVGCPATGAGACADVASKLWLQAAVKRGVQAPPQLVSSWVSAHLLQLSVALIPTSARGLLGGCAAADSLVVSMLQDLHRGLAERLAEVLRCREDLVAKASSSAGFCDARSSLSSTSTTSCAIGHAARRLAVEEWRAAERLAFSSSSSSTLLPIAPASLPPPTRRLSRVQLSAQKWGAASSLHLWIKQHRFLRAVPLEQGETAIALLLLWEADQGCSYPSLAVELVGRLSTFCKRLKEAVTADDELKAWLQYKQMRVALTPGLQAMTHVRWSVVIDPAVGEPFLSSWRAHLTSLVVQRNVAIPAAVPLGTSSSSSSSSGGGPLRSKRQKVQVSQHSSRKRPRLEGDYVPGNSRRTCVAKLKAARMEDRGGGGEVVGFSSSSVYLSTLSPGSLPSPSAASVVRSGRALLGPPT